MRLAVLLLESHMAEAQEDASRLCKWREGRELTAGLAALNWTYRRLGTGREWIPPARQKRLCNPGGGAGSGGEYTRQEKREHA